MSDVDKQELKQQAVPFFARYLEGQIDFIEEISDEETQAVVGGKGVKKLPNDKNHPSSCGSKLVTRKYPSDNEDASGGGGTVVTQKYPSDNEDVSGGGGTVVTLKFPSDNEDASGSVG